METFSALLALCAGNSPVTGEFPAQRPVTRSFDIFFDLPLNKRLSKQSWGWWFETPSCSLWRHGNAYTLPQQFPAKTFLLVPPVGPIYRRSSVTHIYGPLQTGAMSLIDASINEDDLAGLCAVIHMMTSSNGTIFRVTGPLCGEFTGHGEFLTQRPVTRGFDVFFDLRLNKRLSKQPWGWWFETPSWSLWRQCNDLAFGQ